jgi:hypothetical protein
LGLAGLAAFRRSKSVSAVEKPSWVETVLKGVRLAASIWLAFRAHGSNSPPKTKQTLEYDER